MEDTFTMDEAKAQDETLTEKGFESIRTGTENDTAPGGTQLTKAASWADADKTEADVQLQYRYANVPGKDFLFVVDMSASMADFGTPDSTDARILRCSRSCWRWRTAC